MGRFENFSKEFLLPKFSQFALRVLCFSSSEEKSQFSQFLEKDLIAQGAHFAAVYRLFKMINFKCLMHKNNILCVFCSSSCFSSSYKIIPKKSPYHVIAP